ncbi:MAG TPA: PAS domain S-box protein [Thermoanaerobaculia bacterium]|nr:PAS domain S-box protein [Thermoanaerobaculia bacterium]
MQRSNIGEPDGALDAKFQAFLEAAPDAIVVVDTHGRIVAANALAGQMFGHAPPQLLGQNVEILIPAGYRDGHHLQREHYSHSPRTRPMGLGRELRGLRANGEEFPVQISLSPIETENGTLITSIIRDMTTQRLAEARFRGLLESAPDSIIVVDNRGTISVVNSATEQMFGYAREELIGQPIEILVPERSRGRHISDRSDYSADAKTRPMGAGRQLTGRRKDGSEFPVEISLSPLRTGHESLVISIVRDVTERRAFEEQIQTSLREKEALLREIHHRVKNNLQITSSLLRLQAANIGDAHARSIFDETQLRIRSMALVHEKLYQAKNLTRINFGDYVRTLGELLFKSFAVEPKAVSLDVTGADVFLDIDTAVPCGLVVNEIVSNALKHAFPGGRGTIDVRLERNDGTCVMTIRDNGVGLPPQFDLQSIDTLGLQLVRGLVQQIDGTLEVRSIAGTEFRIEFPAERAAHG